MSKLSDVVKNDVVKKAVYDKLGAKVNNIDTSDFVLKTKYQTDKTKFQIALSAVENKIPSVTSLVKKTDYNTKISELEKKNLIIIMTNILLIQSFKSMAADIFNARLAQAN